MSELPPFGAQLPSILVPPPGPRSRAAITTLAANECPAITARRARRQHETGVDQDPIVWHRAKGCNIEDLDGNRYVDLTSAFAVCGLGHAHPAVVTAVHAQADTLIHAMGDVYPSDVKIALSQRLAEITPGDLAQSILGLSGSDAIAAALKTAAIHTGKPGVISFTGSYHGLSYGPLAVSAYRNSFRQPFLSQISPHTTFIPYPDPIRNPFGILWEPGVSPHEIAQRSLDQVRFTLEHPAAGGEAIGAILVEPVQGRGGEVVPPSGFLHGLRDIADEHNLVLIFDEIFTGFYRTGTRFACLHDDVTPDILCLGKGMGGGFPISAAIGTPKVMASWGSSVGEAIHTQTFLGHPIGCATALAVIDVMETNNIAATVHSLSERFLSELTSRLPHPSIASIRGRGLMLGIDFNAGSPDAKPNANTTLHLVDLLRQRGYLLLPSGVWGNVLAITPPYVITSDQIDAFFSALDEVLSCVEI